MSENHEGVLLDGGRGVGEALVEAFGILGLVAVHFFIEPLRRRTKACWPRSKSQESSALGENGNRGRFIRRESGGLKYRVKNDGTSSNSSFTHIINQISEADRDISKGNNDITPDHRILARFEDLE